MAVLYGTTSFAVKAEENSAEKVADGIEVIEVSGTRASLKRALNAKRFSDQVMDGISAEDIGKLPDNNVAEALSRVSGVSLNRADGEGEFVSIRGMAPGLNLVTLNGQTMSSSSNGSGNPGDFGGSRGFDLNAIGSEMVSALEVFKSPTASMIEGAIGGTVNLKTRRAIEVGDKLNIAVKGTYDDTADEYGSGASAFLGTVNSSETFGVLASLNYFDRTTQRNSWESRGWTQKPLSTYVDGLDPNADEDVWLIEDIRSNFRNDDRERLSGNVSFQWLPAENIDVNLGGFFSNQERTFMSTNWDVDIGKSNPKFAADSVVVDNGNLVSGQFTSKAKFEESGFERLYDDKSSAINLTVDIEQGNWMFTPAAGFSSSESQLDWLWGIFRSNLTQGAVGFELPNGSYSPVVNYDQNEPNILPENMAMNQVQFRHMLVEEDKNFAQFDVDYDLEHDFFSSIELGVRVSSAERSLDYQNTKYKAKPAPSYSDYHIPVSVDGMLSEAPVSSWDRPDFDKLEADFSQYDTKTVDPSKEWSIEEDILAFYVQANFNGELFGKAVTGNIGVRQVETNNDIMGYQLPESGEVLARKVSNDYNDTLPSANFNITMSEDVIVRLAAAKVMSRPDYAKLSPTLKEDVNSPGDFNGGNPELEPYRANTFDVSAEWYFNPEGLLSLGLFYKDVESFVTTATEDGLIDPDVNDGQPYSLKQPINGEGATVEGFEFSYQQAFNNGFGVVLNYTYNDSDSTDINPDTGETLPLLGLSEDTYNIIAYYDKAGINFRLAYNYRSAYYDKFAATSEAHFIDDFGQLDFGASYVILDNLTVSFNATNITDEVSEEYVGNSSRGYAVRQNGSRYELGMAYKF